MTGDASRTAATPASNSQDWDSGTESLLVPYREQSAAVRSIIQVSDDASARVLHLAPNADGVASIAGRDAIAQNGGADPLAALAREAHRRAGSARGHDLLVLPADRLQHWMPPETGEFSFRAVAVLLRDTSEASASDHRWTLRRSLFDRGLICIASVNCMGSRALCFLTSEAVQRLEGLDGDCRGEVTIATMTHGGRFANQLFRYSYLKLYALRHGLKASFPDWDGKQVYAPGEPSRHGSDFPRLTFRGFTDEDRKLWECEDPPANIDLCGYFQELPGCWRKHRPLLRRLFQLPAEEQKIFDDWRDAVTEGGQRTLVAIHVRRGDYRDLQKEEVPWFRMVPESWYLDWLQDLGSELDSPVLYVATDEPEAILPFFRHFQPVRPPTTSLPNHVCDFEVLRRADYLAICNSSFSRMAALLAPAGQKCFLPSFERERFLPYEPWIDPAFWARFADSGGVAHVSRTPSAEPAATVSGRDSQHSVQEPSAILFDVSDLLLYLLDHSRLTGIQRVQCEFLHHLLDSTPLPIRFVALDKRGGLTAIGKAGLAEILEALHSGNTPRAELECTISALLNHGPSCTAQPRDVFLCLGALWNVKGLGLLLQQLKNSGVTIGVFIHDILPIAMPEYFQAADIAVFVKGFSEALTFADFILTTSEYNQTCLMDHMASREREPLPVHLVALGHGLSCTAPPQTKTSGLVAEIADRDFVLCVGTLEARKNPVYLFNIWKTLLRSGRADLPYLVFVGRTGWLVHDLIEQLKACNYLDGRVVMLRNVSDAELDLLYRKCLLTIFPSFVEGWGLPVGESLAHGKICLCSPMGGIPEVGGDLADYIDPYNIWDGTEQLLRYLDDPELRRTREAEIAARFEPRSWQKATEDLLRSTQALSRQITTFAGTAAIELPPDLYLPITSDVGSVLLDGLEGGLSADLVCISGWHPPENSGVRASEATALLRFRPVSPVGSKINLGLRLTAHGGDRRIRLQSASGAETEVTVTRGSEKKVVLACEVEPERLVTVRLSQVLASADDDEFPEPAHWVLKGLSYSDPKRRTNIALGRFDGHDVADSSSIETSPPSVSGETISPPVHPEGLLLQQAASIEDDRIATSFGAFLQTPDSYWPSTFTAGRDAPVFADRADRNLFYSGCGKDLPQVGSVQDAIRLIRRSDVFASMSRFSEGALFDSSGIRRGFGYLYGSPTKHAPWLAKQADGVRVDEEALAAAPYFDGSFVMFYNGNLHNYYHWVVEGLLPLDIVTQTFGAGSNLKIAIPKSVAINAVLDHRQTLRDLDLTGYEAVEIDAALIRVREAIWIESDLVQHMPAPYLKDFQRRISARHGAQRGQRNRRLLVARKGPTRRIQNLDEVQAFLSRYDFETVYLEGMSMPEQILLFQSARFVISPHGAALANLLFCEPGTKVIELIPSVEFRPFFWLISEKLDLVHALQFCDIEGNNGFQSSIRVDIGKLQALIRMLDAHL